MEEVLYAGIDRQWNGSTPFLQIDRISGIFCRFRISSVLLSRPVATDLKYLYRSRRCLGISVRDWSRRETRNALMIRPRLLPRRSAHLHWILWRKRLWLYCAVSEAVPLRLVCATRKNLSLSSPRCCCGTKMPKTHSYGSRKASVTAASDPSLRKLKASPSVTS
jgi:hypothetical protein